jgi:hypothetical protein
LKSQVSPAEYARRHAEWTKDYKDFDDDLDDKLQNVIPSQTGRLTPQEQLERQQQIDRLKAVQNDFPWADFFPPDP